MVKSGRFGRIVRGFWREQGAEKCDGVLPGVWPWVVMS